MIYINNEILDNITVVKRSGQRVNFNITKIAIAIKNAFDSVSNDYQGDKINNVFEKVLQYIEIEYKERKTINVEDIQDIIEKVLQEEKYMEVFKSFNNYRIRRAASRKVFSIKEQHKFVKAVEKIALSVKEENHNKAQDIIFNFGNIISKEFAKSYLLDSKFIRAHEEGNIYIHYMESLSLGSFHSCNINLNNLEINENYFDQLITNMKLLKLEVNKEVSLSKIDVLFIPYLIYTFKKVFLKNITLYLKANGILEYVNIKKIQSVINSLNSLELNTSIFKQCIQNQKVKDLFEEAYIYSLEETKNDLEKNICKLLNSLNDSFYSFSLGTSDSYEGKIINEIYLNNINKFTKANTIFKIKKTLNLNTKDPNYSFLKQTIELIKNGSRIKLSFIDNNSLEKEEELEYFANGERIYENKSSLKKETIGRLILAKTSINLSRIALNTVDKNIESYYQELEETLNLIKNQLISTFEIQSKKTKENYNILFQNNLLDDEKLEINNKIRKVIKNGTLNIDIIGLKESAYCLSKKNNLDEKALRKTILSKIRKLSDDFADETKLNFVISISNTRDAAKQLLSIDKTVFGTIKNITDKDFYQDFDCEIDRNLNFNNYLNGGNIFKIDIKEKESFQKTYETIKNFQEQKIHIVSFRRQGEK